MVFPFSGVGGALGVYFVKYVLEIIMQDYNNILIRWYLYAWQRGMGYVVGLGIFTSKYVLRMLMKECNNVMIMCYLYACLRGVG